MTAETWLDQPVLEYIKNNSGKIDSIDIMTHFNAVGPDALMVVGKLIDSGRVIKKEIYGNISVLHFIK